jgi:hypothetical protein
MIPEWAESEWYKEWLKLSNNKLKQPEMGYWYWDNVELRWKFQKTS